MHIYHHKIHSIVNVFILDYYFSTSDNNKTKKKKKYKQIKILDLIFGNKKSQLNCYLYLSALQRKKKKNINNQRDKSKYMNIKRILKTQLQKTHGLS